MTVKTLEVSDALLGLRIFDGLQHMTPALLSAYNRAYKEKGDFPAHAHYVVCAFGPGLKNTAPLFFREPELNVRADKGPLLFWIFRDEKAAHRMFQHLTGIDRLGVWLFVYDPTAEYRLPAPF